jgi:hypothetical protein
MSTKTEKVKIARFSHEQWQRVDDFRYEQRIPSAMQAIRELIDRGLKASAQTEPER